MVNFMAMPFVLDACRDIQGLKYHAVPFEMDGFYCSDTGPVLAQHARQFRLRHHVRYAM